MAKIVENHLRSEGVGVHLGDSVASFGREGEAISVRTQSGAAFVADVVVLGIGVQPESTLAKAAGIELNDRGGIRVDEQMRTNVPGIWAVGDVTEDVDAVTGRHTQIPLAGPANREGRVAADSIAGREPRFRGVQATSVCSVMGLVVATTGANEKSLTAAGLPYERVYLHPGHHVGYFPGAKPISMKLIFDPDSGRIRGAQAVGEAGVERRIDVIAMAIQMSGTVFDLEEAELCYAPQFGAAKDPVNMAGMIASNTIRGDAQIAHWDEADLKACPVLDVRTKEEYDEGHIEGALNIDVNELRDRLNEIPKDQSVLVTCEVGQRGYYAQRMLAQLGYTAKNLSGGMKTGRMGRDVRDGATATDP